MTCAPYPVFVGKKWAITGHLSPLKGVYDIYVNTYRPIFILNVITNLSCDGVSIREHAKNIGFYFNNSVRINNRTVKLKNVI